MTMTRTRKLTVAALFSALAFVLMFFSFSIPILSPFAELDLSAVPEMIGGFMLGPVGGEAIIVIKILLKLIFQGTSSMFTGELQNLILETAFVLPAALWYQRHKTRKGAVTGLAIGGVIAVVISIFTNVYLIFPAYIKLYSDMSWESILAIFATANPLVKDIPTMVAFSVVPFNILSRALTSVITILVYKKLSRLIKGGN